MNLAAAKTRRFPGFAVWLGAVGVGVTSVLSGCASTVRATAPTLVRSVGPTLAVRHVSAARVENAAAAYAQLHEGDFTLTGAGDSMAPIYRTGTVVVVHPTSFFMLRAGLAVVYVNHLGRQVAHVLVEESREGWIAQGLNNAEPDRERVTSENLLGVVACAFVPDAAENLPVAGSLVAANFPTPAAAVVR